MKPAVLISALSVFFSHAALAATVWSIKPDCTGLDRCFTDPLGATTVNGQTLSLAGTWWFMRPGDILNIYPAKSSAGWATSASYPGAAALNISAARGSAANPITIQGVGTTPVKIAQGVNIANASQFLLVSNLDISDNRSSNHGLVIQGNSSDITIKNNYIRNAKGSGINIQAAGPHLTIGPNNVISGNATHGIGIRTNGFDATTGAIGSFVSGNAISANGHHGIELEASGWRVAQNSISGNGTAVGGTSGIHMFNPAADANTPGCNNNQIMYNHVDHQHDLTLYDGNGIQIDSFCDFNTVAFNVVWLNDGAGIHVFNSRGNVIVANTTRYNAADTARGTRAPSAWRGEIILAAAAYAPICNVDTNQCKLIPVPDGRTGGNVVFDNITVSSQANVQGIFVTPDFINPVRGVNHLYPNLYYNAANGGNLNWGGTVYSTASQIDAATGLSASGGGNLVAAPNFFNPAAPGKGSDGLRLIARPANTGWAINPPTADMLGIMPVPGISYYGAYYTK
jgi:parallel beta-helix repeat protein